MKQIRAWRHPVRRLLRVDCSHCVHGYHAFCEARSNVGCYCRIIREHR